MDRHGALWKRRLGRGIPTRSGLVRIQDSWINSITLLGESPNLPWRSGQGAQLTHGILQNYYIPPIILAVQDASVESESDIIRICIDGKQRCSSILNFMDGKIPFVSPNTKDKYWYTLFGNRRSGKQLPDTLKRRFEQISIQVVEYDNIKDEQQRDIFREFEFLIAWTWCIPRHLPSSLRLGSSWRSALYGKAEAR